MSQEPATGSAADTIFALASGAGRAAVAVLRLSGSGTGAILSRLCRVPPQRRASLRSLRGLDGVLLDRALVLWMPGPASYTGEDTAELHLHGGRAVVQAVSTALLHAGARPAAAGEFTRRAFLAGRMDLLEAEAIADLAAAETEAQRVQALRQMQGGASAIVAGWSDRLTRALAFQEALIDFPDDDLPDDVEAGLVADLSTLLGEMEAHLRAARVGERVRAGLTFVIAGPPNSGKSSLFNALAGRDVAIVSPHAGTTRDMLEVQLDLDGVAVTLVDTAGLRVAQDEVEAEGVRRAHARLQVADLVLDVAEGSQNGDRPQREGCVLISSKCDLSSAHPGSLAVSVKTGQGLPDLVGLLTLEASRLTSAECQPMLAHARQTAAVRDAASGLQGALRSLLPELRGEDLRLARAALGRLTGRLSNDEMLDVVFGAFCIGK